VQVGRGSYPARVFVASLRPLHPTTTLPPRDFAVRLVAAPAQCKKGS
jgi:hypothetical protein